MTFWRGSASTTASAYGHAGDTELRCKGKEENAWIPLVQQYKGSLWFLSKGDVEMRCDANCPEHWELLENCLVQRQIRLL